MVSASWPLDMTAETPITAYSENKKFQGGLDLVINSALSK